MGWPNRITLARGVLTVVLWVLLSVSGPDPSEGVWRAAFILFVVTALSDILDGALARRLQQVSQFGRIADPLVDKLLVIGTLAVLLGIPSLREVLPAWAVAVILARELTVTALRSAVEARGIAFGAVASGKGKMVLQCVAVGAVMLHGMGVGFVRAGIDALSFLPGGAARWNIAHVLVWVATLWTAYTAIPYVRRAMAVLRES
jgi:CDP-diacylglycerol--glycerol-3-phosphate 3-phosphatidyltransferase